MLRRWEDLPDFMQVAEVRPYWEILNHRRGQLLLKRVFDVALSLVMIAILLIPMLIIAMAVKLGSPGTVLYRQIRVTRYGKKFKINKFRTMYDRAGANKNGNQSGTSVTLSNDSRVTRVGAVLRKYRMDEFPQIINVLVGDMSFVGTRPEIPKYVKQYQQEFIATLLMPAGITSEASIRYKNEDRLLNEAENVDDVYVSKVLPAKMKWNLESIRRFRFFREIRTMFRTVFAVIGKKHQYERYKCE